ncbi:hypothetical protein Aph02nite_60700 [Actinoplanes philippinensis]|uniref:Uncharacterized protein n=1 Tax=Actinoplanes philippinensis TaxID=35752 RepID=A0A1I2JFK3_9ACTN|nr:hypothetical protein Aph02nite_60700 [Actinoplanes philippinensis]SFF53615.1 hypothetical protein SAMN05421541_112280 [Actinoplanes philippinensis]
MDALGEPASRQQILGLRLRRGLGKLGGVQQRLGQELQRPDRGLQLVADVRHEVTAHPGQPVRLGHVGGLDRDVRRVQRDGPQVQAERGMPAASPASGKIQLDLPAHSGPPDLAGQRTQDRVRGDGARSPAGAEQAHRAGRRIDQHRMVVGVEDDDSHP